MTTFPEAMNPLRSSPVWCVWRRETVNERPTKVPYRDHHRKARTNDPKTWQSFDALPLGNGFAGPGLMLGDGRQGVDLDMCITAEGELEPWAAEIVDRLDSYTERSPSGRGLKVYLLGQAGESKEVSFGDPVEIAPGETKRREIAYYTGKRFFAMTGDVWRDRPLREIRVTDVQWLRERIEAIRQANKTGSLLNVALASAVEPAPTQPAPVRELPAELLRVIRYGAAEGERSEAFHHAVCWCADLGMAAEAITTLLRRHPAGIAMKYSRRLRAEVDRCLHKREQGAVATVSAPVEGKDQPGTDGGPAGDASGRRGNADDPADFDAEVARLAKLSLLEYERQRKDSAERIGVRASVLDRVVGAVRGSEKTGQGSPLLLDDVEPAEAAMPLADLLVELSAAFSRHVVLPTHAVDAAALWSVATWAAEHAHCAPILLLKSPEPRCGKSTLLALLDQTVRRPLPAANITPSALFRTIEAASPTLLIDEGDAFLAGNEELRGVINAGHTRATAFVLRTVGDDHEPRRFGVFGFKALALIGKAPHTITDRSVVVELRRKLPSESVAKLRDLPKARMQELRAALARWAQDDAHQIASTRPAIPDSLNDRAGDSWGPLLAVADLAGGVWPDRARQAAVALAGGVEESGSIGAELLADVRRVFDNRGVDRLSTADLLAALLDDQERPWATYNKGKALSQAQLLSFQ